MELETRAPQFGSFADYAFWIFLLSAASSAVTNAANTLTRGDRVYFNGMQLDYSQIITATFFLLGLFSATILIIAARNGCGYFLQKRNPSEIKKKHLAIAGAGAVLLVILTRGLTVGPCFDGCPENIEIYLLATGLFVTWLIFMIGAMASYLVNKLTSKRVSQNNVAQ